MIYFFLFGYGIAGKILFPILTVCGFAVLIKHRQKGYLILFMLPLFIHLALSAIKMYPFETRLILYLYPLLVIGIAFGFKACIDFIKKRLSSVTVQLNKFSVLTVLIPVCCVFCLYRNSFPILHTEIKTNLDFLKPRMRTGQTVYVYHSSAAAFRYYQDIHYINIPGKIVLGTDDKQAYIDQLKQINGQCWLIFNSEGTGGEQFILQRLDALGYPRLQRFSYGNSSIYLYDLKAAKNSQ